jgi:hypothetical protein
LVVKHALVIVVAALALAVPAASAWSGPPKTPLPTPPQPAGAPPPAWIETQAKSAWLFYGSYCWTTTSIDMIPPETRPGLPVFAVARGAAIRVHLGFAAKRVVVSVDRHTIPTTVDARRRIVSWRASRAGIVAVSARAAAGSASYVARLRVR